MSNVKMSVIQLKYQRCGKSRINIKMTVKPFQKENKFRKSQPAVPTKIHANYVNANVQI